MGSGLTFLLLREQPTSGKDNAMLAHSPMLMIEAIVPTRIVSRVAASPQQIAKIAKALSPSFSGARMTCTATVQHHVKQCTTSAPNGVTLGDERAVAGFFLRYSRAHLIRRAGASGNCCHLQARERLKPGESEGRERSPNCEWAPDISGNLLHVDHLALTPPPCALPFAHPRDWRFRWATIGERGVFSRSPG